MSGPVSTIDAPPAVADCGRPSAACVEVTDSREEQVGKIRVRRALPRRGRRTVGAWCFADHMGPADVTENSGLDVGPHPHIGLQTVTWLIDGQVLHRDSLGTEQVIKPDQLNLMTSGGAVSHAEEATGHYRGTLEGIQLWVALPAATRHGGAAFEHHAELPQGELEGAVATVLLGDFGDLTRPPRHDTALVGVDLNLHGSTTVPLNPKWEYAVVVMQGAVGIDGRPLPPGKLGYLGQGRDELRVDAREPTRAVLLGGEPSGEPIVMWWNFVGPRPCGDRRRLRLLGEAGRPIRPGALEPPAHPCRGAVLAAEPRTPATAEPSGELTTRVRIDRQHPQVYRAQIEVARAVRAAVADAGLDRTLVELINIRVSQINGCAYCLHVHVRDALLAGATTQWIAVLPAWRETTLFTDCERAALTLAESLTTLPDTRTQDLDYAKAATTSTTNSSLRSAG